MKKLLVGAFLGIFTLAGVAVLPNYVSADDGGDVGGNVGGGDEGFTNANGRQQQDTQYNANVAGSKALQKDAIIKTIRTAINWVLGLLSLIALALCLWGGFQMMTSGGDQKKYESGINLLKWAAIGLAIIAASWLIVSLIFFVINGSIIGGAGTIQGQEGGSAMDTAQVE